MKIIILSVCIIALFALDGVASQEGVLSFSSFVYRSEGIDKSGPVIVTGEKNEQNYISFLRIEAFGKKYEISEEKLKDIPLMPYNGIRVSYEQGYKKLGGKTIYISFHIGFNSGMNEKVLITITENGNISIE